MAPSPRDIIPNLWLFILFGTTNDASTHHLMMLTLVTSSVSGKSFVARRQHITLDSILQSLKLGLLSLAVRKSTAGHISGLALQHSKRSFPTKFAYILFSSRVISSVPYRTSNRLLVTKLVALPSMLHISSFKIK